jgi:hypothetical protein
VIDPALALPRQPHPLVPRRLRRDAVEIEHHRQGRDRLAVVSRFKPTGRRRTRRRPRRRFRRSTGSPSTERIRVRRSALSRCYYAISRTRVATTLMDSEPLAWLTTALPRRERGRGSGSSP